MACPETLKPLLDDWVRRYKTTDFIPLDPIRFAHRYAHCRLTCESVALISALFSYGQRPLILSTLEGLFAKMEGDPLGYIQQFNAKREQKRWADFVYRFNTGADVVWLIGRLQQVLLHYGSLENAVAETLRQAHPTPWPPGSPWPTNLKTAKNARTDDLPAAKCFAVVQALSDCLLNAARPGDNHPPHMAALTYGQRYLVPQPAKGGACKRLLMFLRWMVRQEAGETQAAQRVDLGLWQHVLTPAELAVPLDTHVAQQGRALGIVTRQSNDWKTVLQLTDFFRRLDPQDPVRHAFSQCLEWAFPNTGKRRDPGRESRYNGADIAVYDVLFTFLFFV
ncbi:MAG: TIGR02757 family protein [Candidatus Melainabacteria bacterium]|nr:TIGR02757 family protein [Candidatus Melainabacteria bacterium]